MRKLYWILFGYLFFGIGRVVLATSISIARYITLLLWIGFAWFTDQIVVKYITKQILKETLISWANRAVREKRNNKKSVTKKTT